eukprot:TRINITY_DN677_c0_g1_i1.p1 TRINITY_DN677_c0_g1~~TRINITY_DN677_c0_g1_i1.p1  ORF type:complete len:519 (-),score=121.32 TRINITY_DN677_c0_g1_i1:60-1571(-)
MEKEEDGYALRLTRFFASVLRQLERSLFLCQVFLFALLFCSIPLYYCFGWTGTAKAVPFQQFSPSLNLSSLEVVGRFEQPPGRIVATKSGRFFTILQPFSSFPLSIFPSKSGRVVEFFPLSREEAEAEAAEAQREWEKKLKTLSAAQLKRTPKKKPVEKKLNKQTPFPSLEIQAGLFSSPTSLLIEEKRNRLWVLDSGHMGLLTPLSFMHSWFPSLFPHQDSFSPRLLAFDLETEEQVDTLIFPEETAPFGSWLSHFVMLDTQNAFLIADSSVLRKSPAIIYLDLKTRKAKRLLEGHSSLDARVDFSPPISLFGGLFSFNPSLLSFALDQRGSYLYYGALTSPHIYRIGIPALMSLLDESQFISSELVELVISNEAMNDGVLVDKNGRFFLSDIQNSAVHMVVLYPNKTIDRLLCLFQSEEFLRWPGSLTLQGDYIYFSCPALQYLYNPTLSTSSFPPISTVSVSQTPLSSPSLLSLFGIPSLEEQWTPHSPYYVLRFNLSTL